MLLTENDIGTVAAAAVGRGKVPDFLQQFHERGGLIYGIGPAISEYWTAYKMYAEIQKNGMADTPQQEYTVFRKLVDARRQSQGVDIVARSNSFINFKDNLKIGFDPATKNKPASQSKPNMRLESAGSQQKQFFDRFASSSYGIGSETPYASIKQGIEKDRGGGTKDMDTRRYDGDDMVSMRQFMVRRACKFLLYDEIEQRGGRIFYALDGLTLSDVAQCVHRNLDDSRSKVPVCTSELREIFRMWAYLQNHVTFYSHLKESKPPWELSDQEQWSSYALKRAAKLLITDNWDKQEENFIHYQLERYGTTEPDNTKIDGRTRNYLVATLEKLHAQKSYDVVIELYHKIPARHLKRASLPFELRT
jgi:hypothetical protein